MLPPDLTASSTSGSFAEGFFPGVLPAVTRDTSFSRSPLIAIIDDEPINIAIVKKCLNKSGYPDVLDISEPRKALATLQDQLPDVILLDLVMPEVSGLVLLSQIRSDAKLAHVPVLVLTAQEEEASRLEALELGATDLLLKPVRATDLLPRVRNAVIAKKHQDQLVAHTQELEEQVRVRTAELAASRLELIHCLARVAEYRDNETGHHVMRVGKYAGLIAKQLGLDQAQVELIEHAAPLHDIGKIAIPDAVLLKPGKLTPEEMELMQRHAALGRKAFEPLSVEEWQTLRQHTLVGEKMMDIRSSPLIKMASTIALTHHERWDGEGYPLKLAREEIPLAGRIVAVADVFDALSSKRPYKPAFPIDRCFEIMEEGRGTHFDPAVLDAFLAKREEIVRIRMELADLD